MSFLRRLALKSVMAAKKESVAKCAGPLQCGVGRPDGANTMIKTIQYLAEGDNSRVLVALDLKAAFQYVSRRAMIHSMLKLTLTLQQSFPDGTQAPRNIECTTILPTPKSLPTVGLIRVVLCQHVDSQQLLTQHFAQSWRSFALFTTQAPNSLPTLTIGTCGSNRNASYRQLRSSQLLPVQSILSYRLQKHKSGKALAKTIFLLSSRTRSRSHLVVWEDIYNSMEILSPALSFWASRLPWREQHNAFRKLLPRLQTSTLRDANAQTVNDLTMYVGAASQHVLRMSFVPEQEAQNFDRQVLTFWSRLMHRDITSPLFVLPLKLGGFGVGSAVQRHAAAPWRAWQSIIPSLMTITRSPDTDSLFRSNTTTTCPTHSTPIHHLPTNEPTLLPTQTTRSSSTPPNHPKENKSPPSKGTSTNN